MLIAKEVQDAREACKHELQTTENVASDAQDLGRNCPLPSIPSRSELEMHRDCLFPIVT